MRWRTLGLGVAGATVGGLVLLGPAGGAAILAGTGGQPAPGSSVDKTATSVRLGSQPAAGHKGSGGTDFKLGTQPANSSPDKAGKPTQVSGPRERGDTGDGADTSKKRTDRGGDSGADRAGGRRD